MNAQYRRSGRTVTEAEPLCEPWPSVDQLALALRLPSRDAVKTSTSGPKLPAISKSSVDSLKPTEPAIVRPSSVALAAPSELHIPAVAELANAEQPRRAAALALMCSVAPPVAA
ncbi:MAG: hypothetical protein ACK55I_44055, partial [bacterium]